jgi:hypothetical protein
MPYNTVSAFGHESARPNLVWLNNGESHGCFDRVSYSWLTQIKPKVNIKFSRFGNRAEQR